MLNEWAIEELNLGPHAYQAASYEHEFGPDVLTSPLFTNVLRIMSRIWEHLAHFRQHLPRANGHHNRHPHTPKSEGGVPLATVDQLAPL